MPEYTMNDVEMILRASEALDRQQREIRQVVSTLLPTLEQMFKSWNVPRDERVLDVRLFDAPVPTQIVFRWNYEDVCRAGCYVAIDVYFGALRHEYLGWRGGFNPLPSAFVGPVRHNLHKVLNALAAGTTGVRDQVKFLREIQIA